MEDIKAKATNLVDSVQDYAKTYYRYQLLNLTDKATGATAGVVEALTITICGFFFLLFAGIAAGIWVGSLIHSPALGFLIVAGFFFLIILLFHFFKKNLIFPFIRNWTVNKFYKNNDQNVQ